MRKNIIELLDMAIANFERVIEQCNRITTGNVSHQAATIKGIAGRTAEYLKKSAPGNVFVLYQTDPWKTRASRVFFGAFSSFEAANQAAKDNDLYTSESEVVIIETELDKFEEQ